MNSGLILLTGLTVALTAGVSAAEPLRVEDLLEAPTVAPYSPPQFSPDGKLVAYVVTDSARNREAIDRSEIYRSGAAWFGVGSDIWITDLESGQRRNVTGGKGHNWSPSWSPDGRLLAFLADRSGKKPLGPTRLWTWDRASGRLKQVSDADVREGFFGLPWTSDGSIFVSLFPEDLGREGLAASLEGKTPAAAQTGGVTAKVFENDPSATGAQPMTDQVNLDIWRQDLGVIDPRTGNLRRLVRGLRVASPILSHDGKKFVYAVLVKSEKPGAGQYLWDLVTHDLSSGETKTVASSVRLPFMANSFSWSPDGQMVVYRTAGPLALDEVHVINLSDGSSKKIASNPATERGIFEVDAPVWDAAARNVYFTRDSDLWRAPIDGSGASQFAKTDEDIEIIAVRQQRLFSPDGRSAVVMTMNPSTKQVGFARVDLSSGAVTAVVEETRRYGGYGTDPTISSDGKSVAYVAEDPTTPTDIYLRSGDLAREIRVSQVAPAVAGDFGRAEVLEWSSIDGVPQRGALVYPSNYEAGKKYPLIVKVYGGSSISNDLNRFGYASAAIENLQLYATRGYALLLADSKLNVGTPMVDLMKSVMPGVNKAIETGVADPDRLGVMGHSYGGYSTLSLIAQSPRFRAAVMRAGTGNLVGGYGQLADDGTNYGLAWAESGQGRMGGSPWEYRERYLENSPFFYLDRVQTPLLIIHGSEDDAVPAFLADETFTALRRLGKTVTYARYEGESHWEGSWSYPNQVDSINRILEWFDRHLKKE